MKRVKLQQKQEISPWNNQRQQVTLIDVGIENQQKQPKHDNALAEPKEIQPKKIQKQSVETITNKTKNINSWSEYLPKLEQKIIQLKYKKHKTANQYRKSDIHLLPLFKNDLTIKLVQSSAEHQTIPIQHHIKHKSKLKEQHRSFQKVESKIKLDIGQLEHKKRLFGRRSVDFINLGSINMVNQFKKKVIEHDEQITKKLTLKNIQIYEEHTKNLKPVKQPSSIAKKIKQQKQHILDRILARLQ